MVHLVAGIYVISVIAARILLLGRHPHHHRGGPALQPSQRGVPPLVLFLQDQGLLEFYWGVFLESFGI